jgi:hypothetical protein
MALLCTSLPPSGVPDGLLRNSRGLTATIEDSFAETSGFEAALSPECRLKVLTTAHEVALEFEFSPLQRAVHDVRDSLVNATKYQHLAEIFTPGYTGDMVSAALRGVLVDSSPGAGPAVDLAAFDQ